MCVARCEHAQGAWRVRGCCRRGFFLAHSAVPFRPPTLPRTVLRASCVHVSHAVCKVRRAGYLTLRAYICNGLARMALHHAALDYVRAQQAMSKRLL